MRRLLRIDAADANDAVAAAPTTAARAGIGSGRRKANLQPVFGRNSAAMGLLQKPASWINLLLHSRRSRLYNGAGDRFKL